MKYLLWTALALLAYLIIIPIVYSQGMPGEVEMRASMRNLVCAKDFNFAHRDVTEVHGEEIIWEGVVPDGRMLVRLYMNRESGLWTIFELYPDGSGCASTGGNESILKE
jgi:hypothetical protein